MNPLKSFYNVIYVRSHIKTKGSLALDPVIDLIILFY